MISPEIEVRKYMSSSTSQQQKLPIGAKTLCCALGCVNTDCRVIIPVLTSEYIELHPLFDGIEFDVAIIGLAGAMQR